MKKLLTACAACVLAGMVSAQVESVNIVGYSSVENITGKAIVSACFVGVGATADKIGIQSLVTGDFQEDDAIAFYVNGSWVSYVYSLTCDDGVSGTYDQAGWHAGDYILSTDEVDLGAGFFITPVSGTRTVTFAGEVKKDTPVVNVSGAGAKTLVGIGRPLTVAINDLAVTGFGEDDAIAFYDNGSWVSYVYSLTCDDGVSGTYDQTGWHAGDYILTPDAVNTGAGFFVTKYSAGAGSVSYPLSL